MTDNREIIEMLKILKEQALKSHNDTAVLEVKIGSFNFVLDEAIKALEQQPCEDCISRQSIKRRLQEHHDFFIHVYNGFSNMPQNDKSRVDEINNCIAMVVNEPSAMSKEKTGHWINIKVGKLFPSRDFKCSECGNMLDFDGINCGRGDANYCPNCGARMVSE